MQIVHVQVVCKILQLLYSTIAQIPDIHYYSSYEAVSEKGSFVSRRMQFFKVLEKWFSITKYVPIIALWCIERGFHKKITWYLFLLFINVINCLAVYMPLGRNDFGLSFNFTTAKQSLSCVEKLWRYITMSDSLCCVQPPTHGGTIWCEIWNSSLWLQHARVSEVSMCGLQWHGSLAWALEAEIAVCPASTPPPQSSVIEIFTAQ